MKMKTLKLITLIIVIMITKSITAQETGTLKGTVTDEKKQNMPFVPVALMEDSTIVGSTTTDNNGDFTFRLLTPGLYNLKIQQMGYKTKLIIGIMVSADKTSYVYKQLEPSAITLTGAQVVAEHYEESAISKEFSTMTPINIEQIEQIAMPKYDVIAIAVAITPGILPTDDGKDIYMRGSRSGSTAYYIDGNRILGTPEVCGMAVSGMEVLTGGVPAEYGDCTGGLVIITTKDYKQGMRRKRMKQTEREESEEQ
jgi:hypothetical protein